MSASTKFETNKTNKQARQLLGMKGAVDEKKSLSGIIVDGDLRRGLIKNLN